MQELGTMKGARGSMRKAVRDTRKTTLGGDGEDEVAAAVADVIGNTIDESSSRFGLKKDELVGTKEAAPGLLRPPGIHGGGLSPLIEH